MYAFNISDSVFDKIKNKVLITNFSQWPKYVAISLHILDLLKQKINSNDLIYLNFLNYSYKRESLDWLPSSPKFIKKYVLDNNIKFFLKKNNFQFVENKKFSTIKKLNYKEKILANDIKKIEYDGFNIGDYLISSFGNKLGVHNNNKWSSNLLNKYYSLYVWTYKEMLNIIEKNNIKTIFVFNGRFLQERAAVNAAKKSGIKIFYYESGGLQKDFDIYEHTTHDAEALQMRMKDSTKIFSSEYINLIGKQFFEQKSNSPIYKQIITRFHLFLIKFTFYPNKKAKTVFYFTSSEDELLTESSYFQSTLGNQNECILLLYKYCQELGINLIVRVHPNLKNKFVGDKKELYRFLKSMNKLKFFRHYKFYDSYTLLDNADCVITYNSTIGIEAIYKNKPCINFARSFYDLISDVIVCRNENHLFNLLLDVSKDNL